MEILISPRTRKRPETAVPPQLLVGSAGAPTLAPVADPQRAPVGGFLVVDLRSEDRLRDDLLRPIFDAAPWAPVIILVPVHHRLIQRPCPILLTQSPHVQPVVTPPPPHCTTTSTWALATLHARPAPPITTLAAWIARRLDASPLESVLADALLPRPVDEAPAADKRLRRVLRTLGPLTRYQWRRLGDLATCARPMGTVDATAADLRMRPHDYRRWVRRLLGVARKEYEALPGWEPVLELALRRASPQSVG